MVMPEIIATLGRVSLAAACVVYGLIILTASRPKTPLAVAMGTSAIAAGIASFLHGLVLHITGWPALLLGVMMWLIAYATFKHRLMLSRSSRSLGETKWGRRKTDA